MTLILIINAASSTIAAIGIGIFLLTNDHRLSRTAATQVITDEVALI
jgi:hypothetical protein